MKKFLYKVENETNFREGVRNCDDKPNDFAFPMFISKLSSKIHPILWVTEQSTEIISDNFRLDMAIRCNVYYLIAVYISSC